MPRRHRRQPVPGDTRSRPRSAAGADPATIGRFGPDAVAREVARRLDRLPAGAREVALAVAILGPGAAPRHVAALAGRSADSAAAAADALRTAGLLAPGTSLEFAHPILAAAVAAGLGPGQTALLHRRAWRLLHIDGADPERQALQLLQAEPEADPSAVAILRAAAQAANARGAPESATAYLRRALAEPPDAATRPDVLLECGLALAAHRHSDAPALLREAIELTPDPAARVEAGLRAARALALAALYDDLVEICRMTLADTRGARPETVARRGGRARRARHDARRDAGGEPRADRARAARPAAGRPVARERGRPRHVREPLRPRDARAAALRGRRGRARLDRRHGRARA